MMTPTILLVLHRQQSCPGLIAELLKRKGYQIEQKRPALGEPLPHDLSPYAGVVIFGGPMSANDEHLPFIRQEIDWIGHVLAAGTPYLGVCLGAQMLARHLGGSVCGLDTGRVEIGFHPIIPTPEGEPILREALHVYQWHKEGFSLPQGATLLARGRVFENQMFRYGANAYGVQFHPEMTPAILARWLREASSHLTLTGAQCALGQRARHALHGPAQRRWIDRFLTHWLAPGESVHRAQQGLGDEDTRLARA